MTALSTCKSLMQHQQGNQGEKTNGKDTLHAFHALWTCGITPGWRGTLGYKVWKDIVALNFFVPILS